MHTSIGFLRQPLSIVDILSKLIHAITGSAIQKLHLSRFIALLVRFSINQSYCLLNGLRVAAAL